MERYSDVYSSHPWCDHDKGEERWALATVWVYLDDHGKHSYTTDDFTDGDHEPIEEAEINSSHDDMLAWN